MWAVLVCFCSYGWGNFTEFCKATFFLYYCITKGTKGVALIPVTSICTFLCAFLRQFSRFMFANIRPSLQTHAMTIFVLYLESLTTYYFIWFYSVAASTSLSILLFNSKPLKSCAMTDNQASETRGQEKLKPNVKPQQDQKDSNQQGAPGKCEIPRQRSRSSDSERHGRRRERAWERGGRKERGRSEEARRGSKRSSNDRGVTTYPQDNLDETECPICFCNYDNVFKTPKLLSCGHTFCLECLARINVSSVEIKKLSCPVCRELTEIRHGRDLPHLGNNEQVFCKLPPQMQRAQSVRFERSKGKLVLKNAPLTSCFSKKSTVLPVGAIEEGLASPTTVNVGIPPNRVRGRMGRMFESNNCYYTVVVSIIVVAVALVIVGILIFVVMPNVMIRNRPPNDDDAHMTNG